LIRLRKKTVMVDADHMTAAPIAGNTFDTLAEVRADGGREFSPPDSGGHTGPTGILTEVDIHKHIEGQPR
jgi:hypothetical protein